MIDPLICRRTTLAGFALLSACASIPYQEPTAGPVARVRFVTEATEITILRTYDDAQCTKNEVEWLRLRDGPMLNSPPRRLGMPLWSYSDNAAKELRVTAGKPVYGLMQGGERVTLGRSQLCGAPFDYTFEEGADYEVKLRWLPQECQVTVSRIVDAPSGPRFADVKTFVNRVSDTNRGCLAAFHKRRLY